MTKPAGPSSVEVRSERADAVRLDAVAIGTRLRVRAAPGSRRDAIVGVHDGALRIAVRAPAERGRANDALVRVIARALAVRTSDVALVAGQAGRDKSVVVAGVSPEQVRERLERALADALSG